MITLVALNQTVKDHRLDMKTGKVVEAEYNPVEELEKLGVQFLPMPEDYELYRRKTPSGSKPTYLHELGVFALVRVEEGRIVHTFNGNRLNRVQILTMQDIKELREIFSTT